METPESKNPDVVSIHMVFNMRTGEVGLSGCDENPVIALGMFDYALARIRRAIAVNDLHAEAQRASRIVPGNGRRM